MVAATAPDLVMQVRRECRLRGLAANAGARRRYGVPVAELNERQAAELLAQVVALPVPASAEPDPAPPAEFPRGVATPPAPCRPRRPGRPATAGQLGYLRRLARECGVFDLVATGRRWWGCDLVTLSAPEASALIDEVKAAEALAGRYPAEFSRGAGCEVRP